jgi:hypothetical protein
VERRKLLFIGRSLSVICVSTAQINDPITFFHIIIAYYGEKTQGDFPKKNAKISFPKSPCNSWS